MFLQMNKATFPDNKKTLGIGSVFFSNQFIIKAHYLSGLTLVCQRGPGDISEVSQNPGREKRGISRSSTYKKNHGRLDTKEERNMKVNSENNEERKKPGPDGSGEPGTGPDSPEAKEERLAVRRKAALRLVGRVTALRGQSIARPRTPKSVLRRQTQYDIYGKDPEIPYVKFEAVARDLVCSLMERQDRMNEEIFYKINDLAYRIEDLECCHQPEVTGT